VGLAALDPAVQTPDDWIDSRAAEAERKRVQARRREAVRRRDEAARNNRARDVLPRHVLNCGKWGLYFWRADGAGPLHRTKYACQSWRCKHCQRHEAHVLFARAQEAFEKLELPPESTMFMVLTFARQGERAPATVNDAYRGISGTWNKFVKRLRRWIEWMGWDPLRNEWIQTIECHRNGWPHVNVVFSHPQLAEWLREERASKAKVLVCGGCGENECLACRADRLLPPHLRVMAQASGFGPQSTLEIANSSDAALGYIVKVAAKHDQTLGEVAKLTQLPTMAPGRFRRSRSGKRFLPPRKKGDGKYTGTIAMRRQEVDGTTTVLIPRSETAVGADLLKLEQCRTLELNLAEEERCSYGRTGKPLPRPPVMVWQPLIGWFGFDNQAELAKMSATLGASW
jgi:hypothetical protein